MTLLPAVLSLLGDRVDALRLPFVGRERDPGESRFWGSVVVARRQRRPWISLIVSVAFLVALALPALELRDRLGRRADAAGRLPVEGRLQRARAASSAWGPSTRPQVVVDGRRPESEGARRDREPRGTALATTQPFGT